MDIIARDGATLVFVEVKAREGHAFGDAAEAVTMAKRRRMAQIALDYVVRHRLTGSPCRFDVVSVHLGVNPARGNGGDNGDNGDGGSIGVPVIEVYQNAFDFA